MKNLQAKIVTTRKGMGFVKNPDDLEHDILVEAGFLNTALNGDTVEVQLNSKRSDKDQTGEVVRVISRSKEFFVGTVDIERDVYFIIPDDKKMYTDFVISTDEAKKHQLQKDQKVQIKLLPWNDPKKNPPGEIVKILGLKGDNNVEMESIVLEKGFAIGFPPAVDAEAEKIAEGGHHIAAEEIAKRRDFRQTTTLTIDPFDAKDFDDAISFKKLPENGGKALYEVGVHIADVSHYVTEGTELDKEAVKRGCSIYLVDRTIPMLPEALSNDVCSLNPGADKLTFSAVFVLDEAGNVHERWFGRTIINSAFRFTYETAQTVINNEPNGASQADMDSKKENAISQEMVAEHRTVSDPKIGMQYRDDLLTLDRIAKKLQKDKFSKGAIEFETEEIRFKLDEKGKPIGVYKKARIDTHKLVEEFMLLANREVAKFIFDSIGKKGKRDTGAIYRIHDTPDKDRINDLATFAKALGYTLRVKEGVVTARDLNHLLEQIVGTPHESLLRTAAVRSMQKAVYSTKNIGHFGLAFEYYTHFTSPIRRYPDLLVHRILAKHLNGESFADRDIVTFQHIAETSTDREIDASGAERESKKLKQVEYMSERVGKTFQGTISGVTEWGIYVEENESRSEGMINIRNLGDDFWSFEKKTYSIVGQRSQKRYTLGDSITFKVIAADLDKKTLDYALA